MSRLFTAISLFSWLLFAIPAQAAITVTDTQDGVFGFSWTTTAGTDRLLVAALVGWDNGSGGHPITTLSSLDLGATGMTLDATESRYGAGPDDSWIAGIARLTDASLSSDTLDPTFNQAFEVVGYERIGAVLLEGVDQTTPQTDVDSAAYVSTTQNASVTVVAGGAVVFAKANNSGSIPATPSGHTVVASATGWIITYKLIVSGGTEAFEANDNTGQGAWILVSYAPASSIAIAPLAKAYSQRQVIP